MLLDMQQLGASDSLASRMALRRQNSFERRRKSPKLNGLCSPTSTTSSQSSMSPQSTPKSTSSSGTTRYSRFYHNDEQYTRLTTYRDADRIGQAYLDMVYSERKQHRATGASSRVAEMLLR